MSGKHTAALSQPAPWNHVPWHVEESADAVRDANGYLVCCVAGSDVARLIAASPELLEACKLHAAWAESEKRGPQYPEGVTRDNGGDAIWRKWWDANLDLCARAEEATRSALRKASGEG